MTSYVYKSPTWKQVQEFLLDLHAAGRDRKTPRLSTTKIKKKKRKEIQI